MSGKKLFTTRVRLVLHHAGRAFVLGNLGLAAAVLVPSRGVGQALLQPDVTMSSPVRNEDTFDPDARDDSQYSEGTKAIHEGRWADAEVIFSKLALQRGAHSDGAYYWQAYAESKQGKSKEALTTCGELKKTFTHSQWNEECAALAIELGGENTSSLSQSGAEDETARLHAIDAWMATDQPRALAEIRSILSSDKAESLKERALFVLVANNSPAGRQMLEETANTSSDPALQARARQMLATLQRSGAARPASVHRLGINVVVTDESGKAVAGLTAQDFTIRDNKQPRAIESFAGIPGVTGSGSGTDGSTQEFIVIDAVNAPLSEVAYERQQVTDYLHRNNGQLDRLVSVLLFNANGLQRLGTPSRDGNALAMAVAQADATLHPFRRSQGFYGEADRLDFSLDALASIAGKMAKQPGRKLVLWISPGWPLLPWSNSMPTQKQIDRLFAAVVAMATDLRLAQITLYSIDPNFANENDLSEWNRYKEYRKPVVSANDAQAGNLALPLLAEQSGGRVLTFSKDSLTAELVECAGEADGPYYAIHFDTPVAKRKNEFHSLVVTVDRPGLTVRTNYGYYNQP